MRLGADNPEKRVMRLAEQSLHLDEFTPMSQVEKSVMDMDEAKVLDIMNGAFANAKFAVAVVQPSDVKKPVLKA